MRGTILLVLGLGAGCQGDKPLFPARTEVPLAAEYAGCATVWTGPICEVGPDAKLTVWVPGVSAFDPGPVARFFLQNEGLASEEFTEVGGGRRYRVPVRPGELVVERDEGPAIARWRLKLDEYTPVPVVAEAEGLRRSDPPAAEAKLVAALPELTGTDRGEAELMLGKVERQLGKLDEALAHLKSAEVTLREAGHLSGATNAAEVMAFILSEVMYRFAEAEDVLRGYPLEAESYPEGAARIQVYQAYPAAGTAELRRCLRLLQEAGHRTERLDLGDLLANVRFQHGGVLRQLGRFEEALTILEPVASSLTEEQVCARAMTYNNIAVTRSAARRSWEDILRATQQALDLGRVCGDPEQIVLFNLTLAEIAIQFGKTAIAEEALGRVKEQVPGSRLALWMKLLRGQVDSKLDRWEAARVAFREGADESAQRGHRSLEYQARLGEAQVLSHLKQVPGAIAAFKAADRLVEQVLADVPVGGERDAFVGSQDEGNRHYIDLLLKSGSVPEALEISRKSRARTLASPRLADRLDGLDEFGRRRWQRAISAYLNLKAELEVDDWSLSEAERVRRQATRPAGEARLNTLLDEAWSVVGREPDIRAFPAPGAGEVLLHYRQGTTRWWAFAQDAEGIQVEVIESPTSDWTSEIMAQQLLLPFEKQIRRARRVRLLLPGDLAVRDLHTLPFEGQPLAASRQVVYAVDLPSTGRTSGAGMLVVADPRGDLAGARVSGQLITRQAGGRLLAGDEARRPAVLEAMGGVDLFFYAGHGDFSGEGWASHLRLAGADVLTSGDVLLQTRVPRQVVLAGCETAIVPDRAVVPGMSLAHAFAVAGSEVVVATSRPVADAESARFVETLYRELSGAAQGDLVEALHRAARAERDTLDWAAWRVIVR